MSELTTDLFTLLRIDGLVISDKMKAAFSFRRRANGLLGEQLQESCALWLRPGGSIHTFGMRSPIDVLFMDARLSVLSLAENVKPWRIRRAPFKTRSTIELAAGRISLMGLKAGDELFVQPGVNYDHQ